MLQMRRSLQYANGEEKNQHDEIDIFYCEWRDAV